MECLGIVLDYFDIHGGWIISETVCHQGSLCDSCWDSLGLWGSKSRNTLRFWALVSQRIWVFSNVAKDQDGFDEAS